MLDPPMAGRIGDFEMELDEPELIARSCTIEAVQSFGSTPRSGVPPVGRALRL